MSSTSTPAIKHEHVKSLFLLRQRSPWLQLNVGPFRVLHALALVAVVYSGIYLAGDGPQPEAPPDLDDLNTVMVGTETLDAQETLVVTNTTEADASQPEQDVPEFWEPKSTHDYVKVAWVLICIGHALINLFCVWIRRVKVFCQFNRVRDLNKADHVYCVPQPNHGSPGICKLVKRTVLSADSDAKVPHVEFDFRKIRFDLDAASHTFSKVRFPDTETIGTYVTYTGYTSKSDALAALEKWGHNTVEVPSPKFHEMLVEQMLAPFFCFQVFCVLLWCLDAYLYYSLMTLGMLVLFECTVVVQRSRSLADLRAIQVPKQQVYVYREGEWTRIPGEMLLPMDIFSLARGQPNGSRGSEDEEPVVPADALLIGGTAVADEAVLTGESTPQWKEAISGGVVTVEDGARALDEKRDKQHLVFGGTKVLSTESSPQATTGIQTPDGGALAVVLRTGFETAQGRLMRMILFSNERLTANNLETGLFICFLLVFAISAAGYVLHHGLQQPPEKRSRFKLYLNCAMVVTSVIPPELPMELTMAVNNSLLALRRNHVFCTEPFRIPFAGKTEVCCFDKTGTLTSDNMVLAGIARPASAGSASGTQDEHLTKKDWSMETSLVLAACHSLVNVNGDLVGDPLEKAAFNATEWQLKSPHGSVVCTGNVHGRAIRVTIVHKFLFNSELKRMGVIAQVSIGGGQEAPWVLCKGAPEVMEQLLASTPADYAQQHRHHAARGLRIIALAARKLKVQLSMSELKNMSRDQAERMLDFCGLAIFQTPLKEGSASALRMLADSSHQLVMITGDAPLTACYVAQQVYIVDRPVLVLTCDNPGKPDEYISDEHFTWRSPDDAMTFPFERSTKHIVELAVAYDMCLTGDSLAHCIQAGVADVAVACTQVFARVSPDQKEFIVKLHRSAGRTTLMCGDGTNDVGALKAAHVGIALMEPPTAAQVSAARQAAKARLRKRQEEAQSLLRGEPLPPKSKYDSSGQLLPGAQLIKQFEDAGKPVPQSMQKWADWLDQQSEGANDGTLPMLKPGDASMASPFTVKATDVTPVTEIIKQGRCTLVTTLQMFKILGLLCLSSAYSLSVLYLAGVKLGDTQATCQGLLSAGLFFFVANAKPCAKLSSTRPHQHVFSPYLMTSLLLQFALHISFIIYMYERAKQLMAPDERQDAESEFKPNLVNTACFLVQNAIQLITFAVNYVGDPFQTPLPENAGMVGSIRMSCLMLSLLASGIIPFFNRYMQLVDLPRQLKFEFFFGCFLVAFVTLWFERSLRVVFPAFKPPRRGYMSWLHLLGQTSRPKQD